MTAGSPDEQQPQGALHRLAREISALRLAAKGPSLRAVEQFIGASDKNELPGTASRTTISEIVRAKRLTTWETLHAVVVALVRMNSAHPSTPEEEQNICSRIEALWRAAKLEATSEPTAGTASAQRFASELRGRVFTPLGGDFDDISVRLRQLPPDSGSDGARGKELTPADLAAIANGTRTPDRREVDLLLDLLARDGRPLSREDRQAFLLGYVDMLRLCAPSLHERFMVDERLDAYRAYTAWLTPQVQAVAAKRDEERRRQKESHRAQQARLTARLKLLEGDAAAARDRLAALTTTLNETRARESAAVQLSTAAAPANAAPAVTDQATIGLPPWTSLAPHALIADFTDPGTQYDSSAWFGGYSAAYDGHPVSYDHAAPYGYDSYGDDSYSGYPDPYASGANAPSYYATDHGTGVQTLPAPASRTRGRRLLITPFPEVQLPVPEVQPPAVPPDPAPAPPPRKSLLSLFRRPRGKHARGRRD
ncbi:hypothetical protein GCM10011579_036460 [Streptomyces albiflavescens]|uniref:Uncharacterized protein n=1 Tax=Streptomyces albiflavescens TaxID=1623582 RepID=A0A917Y3H3_9ACTN|nr:hypothetical protein [Streptomyces albiflavescens]GGN65722.1 hypothetical protein GCM10011579_036460 [Streptomyces albiflavescens]